MSEGVRLLDYLEKVKKSTAFGMNSTGNYDGTRCMPIPGRKTSLADVVLRVSLLVSLITRRRPVRRVVYEISRKLGREN